MWWWSIAALAFDCTPNSELILCRDQLRDVADTIRFTTLQQPDWQDLFVVDGVDVAESLFVLADRMEAKLSDCPCIGTCTWLEECGR